LRAKLSIHNLSRVASVDTANAVRHRENRESRSYILMIRCIADLLTKARIVTKGQSLFCDWVRISIFSNRGV